MDSFFILLAVVGGLIAFDVLALRFGADTRFTTRRRPDCWW